jgi:hypothetical protein
LEAPVTKNSKGPRSPRRRQLGPPELPQLGKGLSCLSGNLRPSSWGAGASPTRRGSVVSLGKPPGRSAGDAGAAPSSERSLLSLWKPPGRPAAAPGPAASSPGPLLGGRPAAAPGPAASRPGPLIGGRPAAAPGPDASRPGPLVGSGPAAPPGLRRAAPGRKSAFAGPAPGRRPSPGVRNEPKPTFLAFLLCQKAPKVSASSEKPPFSHQKRES